MVFWVAMVLQLDVPALGAGELCLFTVLVGGNAGVDEEGHVDESGWRWK